jgi:hypothetical protein
MRRRDASRIREARAEEERPERFDADPKPPMEEECHERARNEAAGEAVEEEETADARDRRSPGARECSLGDVGARFDVPRQGAVRDRGRQREGRIDADRPRSEPRRRERTERVPAVLEEVVPSEDPRPVGIDVVDGSIACSITSCAPRSRPTPFSMPTNAASTTSGGDVTSVVTSAPTPDAPRARSAGAAGRYDRPRAFASRTATAAPVRPLPTTSPVSRASNPRRASSSPSVTPRSPVAMARTNAAT